ncbi:delta(3,5)-Delta(2,4)-dienoyl-CoA isomerase, mitochondrial-like [Amphiura filiformis]|uniref:delta(3,5)-Delta(2,4)-dienoyl-CoA isomerase, mitochondrial-like n=1 Tax=Amphiura filiformis TaxID=82378 RepID=UPI003B2106EE
MATEETILSDYKFETLRVTSPQQFVYHVELNRPNKMNAMSKRFFRELTECFNRIARDSDCRVVVVSAAGRMFTAGLDLTDSAFLSEIGSNPGTDDEDTDAARKAMAIYHVVPTLQESMTSIEKCLKPVIAAVHGACVGGGVDLVSACDIRMCSKDAWFSIKEVDIGVSADVGTLQRFPKVVGNDSLVRELAYTSRALRTEEAKELGFVSQTFPDKESLINGAMELATHIASKSPVAVQGTKANLVYSRDHSVQEGLDYVKTWNMAMLQTEDMIKAVTARLQKEQAKFSKL